MLELQNIRKTYQMGGTTVQALDGVSLTIEPGEFVAIMGPSGSGKSTLMNVLGLLDTPDSGTYCIEQQDITLLNDDALADLRGKSIGFIFQQFHLLPHLTALENVLLPQLYVENSFDPKMAEQLLVQVGLGERMDHRPTELSGGQQQRVAIARAMVNRPLLLLADEPTGNLDSKSEKEILDHLKFLNEQGVTIVVVTHEESVGQQAKRLIRMRDGRIHSDERMIGRPTDAPKTAPRQAAPAFSLQRFYSAWTMQFKQAIANLKGHKLRTLLSTLGITIGVGSVVAMMTVGEGFKEAIDKQISFLGQNIVLVEPGKSTKGREGNPITLEVDVGSRLQAMLPQITRTIPIQFGNAHLEFESKKFDARVIGVGFSFFQAHSMEAREGILFDRDTRTDERVVVLGQELAKEIFGDEKATGSKIRIGELEFEIVAVIKSNENIQMYGEKNALIIPIDTAIHRITGKREIDLVEVEAKPGTNLNAFTKQIQDSLSLLLNIPESAGEEAFKLTNIEGMRENISKVGTAISFFLGLVASISLLVGGIGIMNIMLVTVTERTKEIGLRKAIGARQSIIFLQFLIESKMVCLLGGMLGVLGAWALCSIINIATDEFRTHVTTGTIILGCSFSIFVGLVSGIYPARRAAKLNPIDALRSL